MNDLYACLTCGDCHPGPCLPPVLPTPEALRTILDVTVHAGECEKVLRAYAEGRLIDGQAIIDAWNAYREDGGTRYSEAMDNFVGIIMGVVESNNG